MRYVVSFQEKSAAVVETDGPPEFWDSGIIAFTKGGIQQLVIAPGTWICIRLTQDDLSPLSLDS